MEEQDYFELSIIVPCLNEKENLTEFCIKTKRALENVTDNYELILIDDGSTDGTRDKIFQICEQDKHVRGLILSRNFGKELALSAGLHNANGNVAVLIDADLQHPPGIIPEMILKWKKGAKIVTAVRLDRHSDSLLRHWSSRIFYSVFNLLSDVKLNSAAGDFRLLDRSIMDVLNKMPERARFSKGLFSWIGFQQEIVKFKVEDRFAGKPKFSYFKLFLYSISSLVSFSVAPIRIWFLFGLIFVLSSSFYGAVIAIEAIVYGVKQPGFVTTIMFIIFFGGFQMLSLGIFGEYIGRILLEVKARPQFIVMEELGNGLNKPNARNKDEIRQN